MLPRPAPLKPTQVDPDARARAAVRTLMPNLIPGTELDVVRHLFMLTSRVRRYGLRETANRSLAANDAGDIETLAELTGLPVSSFYEGMALVGADGGAPA